jgi:predicted RNase H-like HicB family nuclease
MTERRYPVIIEQTGTGYSAYSPDVAGCAAAGDTKEETRRNFQDALSAHFEMMREVGEPIPEPNASVDYVDVAAWPNFHPAHKRPDALLLASTHART